MVMRKWARVSKSSRTGFMEALCGDAPTEVTCAKEALRGGAAPQPTRPAALPVAQPADVGALRRPGELAAVVIARQVIAERPSFPPIYLCLALAFAGLRDVPGRAVPFCTRGRWP